MRSKKRKNVGKFVTSGLVLLFVALAGLGIYSDSDAAIISNADPKIKRLGELAGMSPKGMAIFLRTQPTLLSKTDLARACSGSNVSEVDGCFDPNSQRIYLRDMPKEFDPYEAVTAAHEMLHAALYAHLTMDESLKDILEQEVIHNSRAEMRETLRKYHFNSTEEALDEVHAYLGSEAVDIPEALEIHYSQFFESRAKVVDIHKGVTEFFKKKEASLHALASEIEASIAHADRIYGYHLAAADRGSEYYANLYYSDYTHLRRHPAKNQLVQYTGRRLQLHGCLIQWQTNRGDYSTRQTVIRIS